MKFCKSALIGLSLFTAVSSASAVPIFNFNDSANHDNFLNIDSNKKLHSTFDGVTVSLAGDFLNPTNPGITLFSYDNARITIRDILVGDNFASGEVSSLAAAASGGVFNIYSGNTKLIEANLGVAQLSYSYTGTSGPQNDPIYVLRYNTADLDIVGGIYSSYFALAGFNGFLDLVFDNTANGFLEFAGGSLYGASSCTRGCGNTAVPEPATMALLGAGGLAMLRRRKRV